MFEDFPAVDWTGAHNSYLESKMSSTQFYRTKFKDFCLDGTIPPVSAWKKACIRLGNVSYKQRITEIQKENTVPVISLEDSNMVSSPVNDNQIQLELNSGVRLSFPTSVSASFLAELLTKTGAV